MPGGASQPSRPPVASLWPSLAPSLACTFLTGCAMVGPEALGLRGPRAPFLAEPWWWV